MKSSRQNELRQTNPDYREYKRLQSSYYYYLRIGNEEMQEKLKQQMKEVPQTWKKYKKNI